MSKNIKHKNVENDPLSRRTLATRSVRAGLESDALHGSVVPPIYLSSNFAFEGYKQPRQYDYTRSGNPTRDQLSAALADLEGGAGAVVTCTGLAAITLILSTLPAGARVIAPYDCYGGSYRLLAALQAKGTLQVEFIDQCNPDAIRAALATKTDLVWIETPSNPLLRVVDIRAITEAARAAQALSVVDNTFLSPIWQQPLALGADRAALHHQVFERPQRCGRGRGNCRNQGAARESCLVGERDRRDRRTVRLVPDAARRAYFARAHARACREHRRDGGAVDAPCGGSGSPLSRTQGQSGT